MRAERLLERDQHGRDVLPVPRRIEDLIAEAQRHQILHHFLAQIMIDAVQLLLAEQPGQMVGQVLRGGGILAERLLDDDAIPALRAHARLLDVHGDRVEDAGRQRQIEQAIGARPRFVAPHLLVEDLEVASRIVAAGHVEVVRPELGEAIGFVGRRFHVRIAFDAQLIDGERRAGVAVDCGALREEVVAEQPPERRVDLLAGQVALIRNQVYIWQGSGGSGGGVILTEAPNTMKTCGKLSS